MKVFEESTHSEILVFGHKNSEFVNYLWKGIFHLGTPPLTDSSLKCKGTPTKVTLVGDPRLLPQFSAQ